jgi:hypothetical protein
LRGFALAAEGLEYPASVVRDRRARSAPGGRPIRRRQRLHGLAAQVEHPRERVPALDRRPARDVTPGHRQRGVLCLRALRPEEREPAAVQRLAARRGSDAQEFPLPSRGPARIAACASQLGEPKIEVRVGVDGDPPVERLSGVEVTVRVRQVGQPFDRGPVSRRARERPRVERGRGAPFASSPLDVAELGPAECLLLGDRPGGDSRARNPELARGRLRAAQSLEPKRRLEVPGHRPRLEPGERIGRALVAAGRERRIEQDRPGARG